MNVTLKFSVELIKLCRTIMREHIPKRHLDFENPIHTDKVFDNTNGRIHGEKILNNFSATSHDWGTSKNSADLIPRVGRKTLNFEKEIAAKIAQEQ